MKVSLNINDRLFTNASEEMCNDDTNIKEFSFLLIIDFGSGLDNSVKKIISI
jgi:hypothetical protein